MASNRKNIGIYAPNWVGDAVMAIPFLNRCRERNPEATITVIAKTWLADVLKFQSAIDQIITFEDHQLRGFRNTIASGRSLISQEFDQIYLLSDSLRSGYLSWITRAKERIGFKGQYRSGFLSHALSPPSEKGLHRSARYLHLLGDTQTDPRAYISPGITIAKEERTWAQNMFSQLAFERPIAVFPSSVAPSRRVPPTKWIEILTPLVESNRPIIFIGSNGDAPLANEIIEVMRHPGLLSVCGQYPLRKSIALIGECASAIASDSGLGHISANLGIPTVSLFGAGDPANTRPLGRHALTYTKNVDCSPCRSNKCRNKKEPLICLDSMSATAIVGAMNAV